MARPRSNPKGKKPYHHGDLRRALLDAALGMLDEPGGASLLTLREVARRAGVTHAAPYRHFESKEALLSQVAEEGFRQLHEQMLARSAAFAEDPLRRLQEIGIAYVLFAASHPAHFRVMFGADLVFNRYPGLREVASATFGLLVESIIRGQAAGIFRAGPPMELAVASWSMVNGLSVLIIDRRLQPTGLDAQGPEQLAGVAVRILQEGLLPRSRGT